MLVGKKITIICLLSLVHKMYINHLELDNIQRYITYKLPRLLYVYILYFLH